jgi:predicted nucleic acid-binding Zn ribbon protein
MEQASEILGATLKRMRDSAAASAWLQARWVSLIGEALGAHVRPIGCARGVLRLEADSDEWKRQAEAMEQQMRERINQSWKGSLVRELRIDLKPPKRRLAFEVDNNHLPFLRKNAKKP